ncbi:MAG: CoxG family protein [Woeseiaceae bacterium]
MAIEFDGDFTVATPREDAYAVLSETQSFAPLLPTYKSHELKEDGSADVKIAVGVGKVRGTATVNLMLEESEAPIRARYVGKGTVMGGVFNFGAQFELEEAGRDETHVKWQGELVMYGKLVSLAGGMIKPIANRDIERLITAVQRALSGEAELPEEPRPGWISRVGARIKKLWARVRGLFRPGDKKPAV